MNQFCSPLLQPSCFLLLILPKGSPKKLTLLFHQIAIRTPNSCPLKGIKILLIALPFVCHRGPSRHSLAYLVWLWDLGPPFQKGSCPMKRGCCIEEERRYGQAGLPATHSPALRLRIRSCLSVQSPFYMTIFASSAHSSSCIFGFSI